MRKYKVRTMKFSEIEKCVEIPKFQRGLVWDKGRKEAFIHALKDGLPIGALLFSKMPIGEERYLVIDGLQRYTTMLDYSKNPFRYIKEEEITDNHAVEIILSSEKAASLYDRSTESGKDAYRKDIRSIIVDEIKNGGNDDLFAVGRRARDRIISSVSIIPSEDKDEIFAVVFKIISDFSKNASIKDIEVPVIIFTGNQDELASIYQSVNQQGVKLSKYDVYAATWINHTVVVKEDPEFLDYIIGKYNKAKKESGLEVSNFDPIEMKRTGELSVFEYAFGMGKQMSRKCSLLFGSKKDDSKIEGISFLILAELFGLDYLRMGELAEELVKYNSVIDFKKLKDAIVDICVEVESVLSPYISAPTAKKTTLACHADLQLASYIIAIFRLRYELSPTEGLKNVGRAKLIHDVKRYLPKHYLYDILRDYWSGAGNVKLEEEVKKDPKLSRYVGDVDKPSFEQAIVDWLQQGNNRMVATISMETKLFWNYYLRHVATANELAQGKFDIEHCVPQEKQKTYFTNQGFQVPTNSPCNLVYIPVVDNRSKGDRTYYQKKAQEPTLYQLDEAQLDRFLYPTHSELTFVESAETMTVENYMRFLKERVTTIRNRLMQVLYQ